MRENLDDSLRFIFGHEGGYSSDPADRGNYLNGQLVGTKYGITGKTLANHRGVPHVSADAVRNLTMLEAEDIYRKSYWSQSGGDLLPSGLDHVVFDMGVNAGPNAAVKILQRLVGFKGKAVDGVVGGQTLTAVDGYVGGLNKLIQDYAEARIEAYRGYKTWKQHGDGWTKRARKAASEGLALARGAVANVSTNIDPSPKAIAQAENPWTKPETFVQGIPLLSGLGFLFQGDGPAQYAAGAALVIAALVAGFYFVRRIQQAEA